MIYHDIARLPMGDQVVTRAAHAYYRALLQGSPRQKRQYLWQTWVCAIHRRWRDLPALNMCKRCRAVKSVHCSVQAERRYRMIAEAAYYRAERRRFQNGNPIQDWLEAEREIDQVYVWVFESFHSALRC
jgi:hypothetical protein